MKEYGKQRFYLSRQDQYDTPSADEMKAADSEILTRQANLKQVAAQRRATQLGGGGSFGAR